MLKIRDVIIKRCRLPLARMALLPCISAAEKLAILPCISAAARLAISPCISAAARLAILPCISAAAKDVSDAVHGFTKRSLIYCRMRKIFT